MTPEQARADERARVAAWLRNNPHGLSGVNVERASALLDAADAIERGDHLDQPLGWHAPENSIIEGASGDVYDADGLRKHKEQGNG